jgi:hypothetical protein
VSANLGGGGERREGFFQRFFSVFFFFLFCNGYFGSFFVFCSVEGIAGKDKAKTKKDKDKKKLQRLICI